MSSLRAFGFALLCCGCSGDDGPEAFAELAVEVENEIGGRSQITCEALPFLPGSRRLTEHVIDDAFTITVFSSASEARLSFEEGTRALHEQLVISRSALEAEYTEELTLTLGSGQSYFVSIGSGCAP